MSCGVVAAVVVSVASAAMSYSSQKSAQRDAKNNYYAQQQLMAQQAEAEASAVWESARAQAGAIEATAAKERALFYKEAESARAIAYSNIELMRQESVESVRRLRLDQEQMESRGRAAAAASGVRMEGSIDIAIKDFENENKNQLNWLDKSLQSKIGHASFEANEMYNMYREKANTAFETAKIAAGSILSGASAQVNALKKQASSYTASYTNYQAQNDERRKAIASMGSPSTGDR